MDEELIILETEEITEADINSEDMEQTIEQEEVIEYVEVEDVEEINIEVDEAIGWVGGDPSKHYSLSGRDEPDQHTIESITGLKGILDTLSSVKDISSIHGGYAEFRPWLTDGYYRQNYLSTGGVGYFVSLVSGTSNLDGNNTYVDICHKKNADGTVDVKDVYGVTVANSGFYGYQDEAYDLLDTDSPNRADNPLYAKVCLLGAVKVRVTAKDHLDIVIGDYVVPNELGYAQKSENDVGFKVISKGQIESSWHYVEIALVPQNDNIARVMKKIEDTQVNLEGITIQLGGMSDKITNIETDIENSKIQLGENFKGLENLVNESNKKIDTQLPEMEQKLQEAVDEVVSEANKTINDMTLEYTEAVSKANEAKEAIYGVDGNGGVLKDIKDLQDNIKPLATWKSSDGASSGTVGFLAQAEKDHTELSSLTSAFGENGSDLTAIIQKIDSNGAAIQHMVSHIDKYTLGARSPAYGLSTDEVYILQPGHIYVPTEDHSDEDTYITPPIEFKLGKSYEWGTVEPEGYMWREYGDVSTSTSVVDGTAEGDLWYCWQGILKDNKYSYDPGTLYRWDNTQKMWLAVASVNNNSTARVTGLIRQTADKLTSVYTDLDGNVSALEQEVGRIGAIVENMDSGSLSKIEQTADDIIAGVYNPNEGSTSLELLLNGMQSISNYGGRTRIAHYLGEPTISDDTKKYSQPPMWDGEKFVFSGEPKEDGIYYLDSNDNTKYYKIVNDGYEHYTIGSQAIALLETQVDDNKSEIKSLADFKTTTSETLAAIEQKADANSAEIASVVSGDYVVCSNINLEPTDDELALIPSTRYVSAPKWTDGKFVFDEDDLSTDGVYYMLDSDDVHYYKLLANGQSYEQYGLDSSGLASIIQYVTKQGSSIGLLVDDNGVKGGILVEAINGQSTATISADKIDLNGYVTISSLKDGGTTEIDGSRIITGSIASKNYLEPFEGGIFAQAGTKFNLEDGTINSENFNLDGGNVSITGKITATSGYIGNDINGFIIQKKDSVYTYTVGINGLSEGVYYFKHTGKFYSFEITDVLLEGVEIEVNCNLKTINIDGGILTELEEPPVDAIPLSFKDITHYYLGNNQTSYDADGSGNAGVYVGPDGIGLGNGNFYVDNLGNLTTNGSISMRSNSKEVLKIENGSIILSGSISWDTSSNPLKVLYARKNISKPPDHDEDGYKEYSAYGQSSTTTWHTKLDASYDYYVSYSYDGGKTWTDTVKIQGEDGVPGGSANIPNYIHETYIDSTEIRSPQIYSNEFSVTPLEGGNFNGFKLYGTYNDKVGCFLKISYDEEIAPMVKFETEKGASARWGFAGTEISGTLNMTGQYGALNITNGCTLNIGTGSKLVLAEGATVTGLKVTFG